MQIIVAGNDITEFVGNINLNTSLDTLGASLTFDVAKNFYDSTFKFCEDIKVGDVVILNNEKELFKGIILDISISKFNKNIKCLDFCFYLNKNKVIKQFEEISASDAIRQLLQEVNAPIGKISSIATSISKTYNSNTIAEIIDDILKQVNNELGIKYIIEFENNVFNIVPFKEISVELEYIETLEKTATESIMNMKNKVLVISNEQEESEILATAQDNENMKKYGSLQEIINVDPDEDEAKVRNIAKTKLKELNKVFKTVNFQGFGNDEFKAGRIINLDDPEYSIQGTYLIKNCSHIWKNNEHLVNLEVEYYER